MILLLFLACKATPTTDKGEDSPLTPGDALSYEGRSATSSFWETTDVLAIGEAVYTCTGVNSLVVHDARDPTQMDPVEVLRFPGSSASYPRCTHLAVGGDRVVVVSHADEIQPTPFLALLDVSSPLAPVTLDTVSKRGLLLEEAAASGNRAIVAGVSDGLLAFDLEGGSLRQVDTVGGVGSVTRTAAVGDGWVVGTAEGAVHRLSAALEVQASNQLEGVVQSTQGLQDGTLAVALGSGGIVQLDAATLSVVREIDTHGTALRLDQLENGDLLVANGSDVRVYDLDRQVPLKAVDAVFQADEPPRIPTTGTAGFRDDPRLLRDLLTDLWSGVFRPSVAVSRGIWR